MPRPILVLRWLFGALWAAIPAIAMWLYFPYGRLLAVFFAGFCLLYWVWVRHTRRKLAAAPTSTTDLESGLVAASSFVGKVLLAAGGIAVLLGTVVPRDKEVFLGTGGLAVCSGAYYLFRKKKPIQRNSEVSKTPRAILVLGVLYVAFALAISAWAMRHTLPRRSALLILFFGLWLLAAVVFRYERRRRMGAPTSVPEFKRGLAEANRFTGKVFLTTGGIAVLLGTIVPRDKEIFLIGGAVVVCRGAYFLLKDKELS